LPPVSVVDERGIDLTTGTLNLNAGSIAIGNPDAPVLGANKLSLTLMDSGARI
jgi:hypothetical protein